MNALGREVRLITFDLDDTLVDTFGGIPARVRHAVRVAATQHRVPLPAGGEAAVVSVVMEGHPDLKPANLLRGLGIGDAHPARAAVLAAYHEKTLELLQPVAGAVDLLDLLAGRYALAVITNGEDGLQRAKLRRCGLDAYFSCVLASEGIGIRKPDPAIFRMACEQTGVPPAFALHVGDSPESDIAGARAAGFAAVLLETAIPHGPGAEPDVRVARLAEVAALLGHAPLP